LITTCASSRSSADEGARHLASVALRPRPLHSCAC
jgi:hypothetical protein